MCGIIGIVSKDTHSIKHDTLQLLKRLEYRGYDSAGVATLAGDIQKQTGHIDPFIDIVTDHKTQASIAHTRWATHGGVTALNAHPHADGTGQFMIVHNGILENADALRASLPNESLVSETDSEVVAAFFHDRIGVQGLTTHAAIHEFIGAAEGTYAILLMQRDDPTVYAIKHNSPLALTRTSSMHGATILASDITAFGHLSDQAQFFEDQTYCRITPDSVAFFNAAGDPIEIEPKSFEWKDDASLDEYPHFMIKEIMEQPMTSRRLLESLNTMQAAELDAFATTLKKARRVVFLSCGTSYHASLIGAFLLNQLNYEAHTVIASEFENFILVDPSTFVIAISQSGETMDVILPLKRIEKQALKIGSIVNVPYSTIQRHSDTTLELLAGQEICVASTKAYTNQVIMLIKLAERLGYDVDCDKIPGRIEECLASIDGIARELAVELKHTREMYVLGRGAAYPMAREIALKLKEIDYIHAEGMMAGELKHGTLALIEDGTPVICLIHDDNPAMRSSTREVEARGARSIVVSNTGSGEVNVPAGCEAEFAIYSCLFGHLLSYYIGVERSLPIDKPRNLAKSVTVG